MILQDCIKHQFKKQLLNEKRCLKCEEKGVISEEAYQSVKLVSLPDILIVQFKRFSYEGRWEKKYHTE